jgi:membrane protease YdiL (CAAX protease family)
MFWLTAFLVLAVAEEVLGPSSDAWGSWKGKYDSTDLAVRIAAIGLVYPIAEEFFFRGAFLGVVRRRFGAAVAVIVTAIVFALIHVQYDWPIWILVHGLLYAACRISSGSLYLPILLHGLGNSYAIWERLQ